MKHTRAAYANKGLSDLKATGLGRMSRIIMMSGTAHLPN